MAVACRRLRPPMPCRDSLLALLALLTQLAHVVARSGRRTHETSSGSTRAPRRAAVRSRAMSARTAVDGEGLARLVEEYRDLLRSHQEELNRLNVYPVPDGDTGTNMALTLESVCNEIGAGPDPSRYEMGAVCQAIAHG